MTGRGGAQWVGLTVRVVQAVLVVERDVDWLVRGVFGGVDEGFLGGAGEGQAGVGRQGPRLAGHIEVHLGGVVPLVIGAEVG